MYAITDIETSGRDPWRNEIIQIATIIADKEFKVVKTFNKYLKPERRSYWDEGAEKIHGITWNKSRCFDNRDSVLNEYIHFLNSNCPDGGHSFVAHALPFRSSIDFFDRNFLFAFFWVRDLRTDFYKLFPEGKTISTIHKKRKLATQRYQIKDQKLSTWADKLNFELDHHDALSDTKCCLEVLKYQKSIDG